MIAAAVVLASVAAAAATALLLPASRPVPRAGLDQREVPGTAPPRAAWGRRGRVLWAGLGGFAILVWADGPAAWAGAPAVATITWWAAGRTEPPAVRAERERARTELPLVVELVAASLRGGAATAPALRAVSQALPGPATRRLRPVLTRLDLGTDPAAAWHVLTEDEVLAPLGRTLTRAERSGAPVADAMDRLAEELAARGRSEVERRARTVGVQAALPLGLLLLPAFLLIGIVPLVAAALQQVAW